MSRSNPTSYPALFASPSKIAHRFLLSLTTINNSFLLLTALDNSQSYNCLPQLVALVAPRNGSFGLLTVILFSFFLDIKNRINIVLNGAQYPEVQVIIEL